MMYSASEAANKLGMSKDTLRYYEKEGLLPPIKRNESCNRVYSESDIEWIFLIRCLRDTEMSISNIKRYVGLLKQGGESIPERREILLEHESFIDRKVSAFQNILLLIKKKVEFYDEALSSQGEDAANCMNYETEWENFKIISKGSNND